MIYVILGQTASGKSDLAIRLARELNLPLIGADAFQVYKEFNIGSAKPTKKELEGIEYYLIDDRSVSAPLNVKEYQEEGRKLLDKFQAEGRDVILCGGTFLYVRALLFPYEFTSEETPDDGLDNLKEEELLSILEKEDPETYKVIDRHNLRRVIRAIRIAKSGKKKSDIVQKMEKPLYPCRFFAIDIDRDEGNARIDARVDKMMKAGLIEETSALIKKFDASLSSFQAIGYKEVIAGLKGGEKEEDIASDIKQDTKQYAKRQRTFLRHQFPALIVLKAPEIFDYIVYDAARRRRNKVSLPPEVLSKIERSHVVLVGVGGVGSIVADGLVRLGVSHLTLIDMDKVDASNMNRQILYTSEDVGKNKAEQAKKHLLEIDPLASVQSICAKYEESQVGPDTDFIFDCIDDVPSKTKLIIYAQSRSIPCVSATGSGLRKDATKFKVGHLTDTGEPLAKALKKELAAEGFEHFEKVNVAYSSETPEKRQGKEIGSNFLAPNSEGLALLTYFISALN